MPGMLAVAWVMSCRLADPRFVGTAEGEGAVLRMLDGFNGFALRPSPLALGLAELVLHDPSALRLLARGWGLDLDEMYFYAMSREDVARHGWPDGDVVLEHGPTGQEVHLYQDWPGETTSEPVLKHVPEEV